MLDNYRRADTLPLSPAWPKRREAVGSLGASCTFTDGRRKGVISCFFFPQSQVESKRAFDTPQKASLCEWMEIGRDERQTRRDIWATFWRLWMKAIHQRNPGGNTKAKEVQGKNMSFLCSPYSQISFRGHQEPRQVLQFPDLSSSKLMQDRKPY